LQKRRGRTKRKRKRRVRKRSRECLSSNNRGRQQKEGQRRWCSLLTMRMQAAMTTRTPAQ